MKAVNTKLIKQAVLTKLARRRQATAHTKTRGEVRGGGAKPWRQKGTGRARAGSRRSPIWVGGGTVFGPTKKRNFKRSTLPKKMNRLAIKELLLLKNKTDRLIVLPKIEIKEPRTKAARKFIESLDLAGRRVIFVTAEIKPELLVACDNLKEVSVIQAKDLSVLQLINDATVAIENAILENYFGIKKQVSTKKVKASQ